MKLLSQLLALLVVSANALQILFSIGTIILILKLSFDKIRAVKSRWIDKKRRTAWESDMWAIE